MNCKIQKIKQNKNIVTILIAFMIIVSILTVSSFAYTDNSTNGIDFEGQPIPYTSDIPSNTWLASNGFNYSIDENNNYYNAYCAITSVDTSTYVFAIPDTDFWRYYAVSVESNARIYWTIYSTSSTSNAIINTYDSNSGYYYKQFASINNTLGRTPQVPIFDTEADGLLAVKDWIENPPVDTPLTGAFSTTLQPGYAMYIDITNLNPTVQLTQTTSVGYWGLGATQFCGVTSSIPNPITEDSVTQIIDWHGTGRADAYGKYTSWYSNLTVSGITSDHGHAYFAIINPLNNTAPSTSGLDVPALPNGIITVNISNSNSVKIYPMSTTFNLGNYGSESGDVSATGVSDGSGGLTFVDDQTGDTYIQEYGGLTQPENTATTIHDFLQSIANSITGFFSGAIGAVSTLVNAGKDFFGVLVGLYAWLPPAVYAVLTSALVIVITIGVIKVFI